MLVTTSPCESCGEIIAPYKPKGIMTNQETGKHFTRAADMVKTREFLEQKVHIPFIPLP